MRVLLLNQYFPPDRSATAALARDAVEALAAAGHEVRVVAGWPSYQPAERWPWRPVRRQDGVAGGRVTRVGSAGFGRDRMTARIANYGTFLVAAAPVASATPANVVVAMTDPPVVGVLAAAVAAARRRPFVYWVQDLHPEVAVATGLLRDGRLSQAWRSLHAQALRRADRVVVLGRDMADRVVAAGARPECVRIVHNGAPAGLEPHPTDRDHPVAVRLRGGHDFVVMHAGNLGFAGAWGTLLEAAPHLESGTGLVFVGNGAQRAVLRRRSDRAPGVVAFHDPVPSSELRWLMAAADLHVVTLRRGLEGLVVPSKLYGILAAGRPALVVADDQSEAARLVRRHRCGLTADPDRPDSVAHAIGWARRYPDELKAMGRRAREASFRYDRTLTMAQLLEVIEQAAALRPVPRTVGRSPRHESHVPSHPPLLVHDEGAR